MPFGGWRLGFGLGGCSQACLPAFFPARLVQFALARGRLGQFGPAESRVIAYQRLGMRRRLHMLLVVCVNVESRLKVMTNTRPHCHDDATTDGCAVWQAT
jgi:hypothetical protein